MSKEEYESLVEKGTALMELVSSFMKNVDIDNITSWVKLVLENSVDSRYPNHPGYPEAKTGQLPTVEVGTFDYAIDLLKQGRKVRRRSWVKKFLYLKMSEKAIDGIRDVYVGLYNSDGEWIDTKGFEGAYVIRLSDMNASDWEEVE